MKDDNMTLRRLHTTDSAASTPGRMLPHRSRRTLAALSATALAISFSAGVGIVFGQEEGERNFPIDITHSVRDAPAPIAGAVFGSGTPLKSGDRICTTPTQTTANVDTDCEKS